MNKTELVHKIAEILGVSKPKDELAFEVFLEKISERLSFNEALRIPGIGIFQLREEPFTGVKKSFPGVDSGSKSELMFAPFSKESETLYLTFDVKKRKKDTNQFSDEIFSISVDKPIVPITGNVNQILDTDTSYILLRKNIGELVDQIIDKSDFLENFDIWEDYINSQTSSNIEILEEIELEEKFTEVISKEKFVDISETPIPSAHIFDSDAVIEADAEIGEQEILEDSLDDLDFTLPDSEDATEETISEEAAADESDLQEINLPDEGTDQLDVDNLDDLLDFDTFEDSKDDLLEDEIDEEMSSEEVVTPQSQQDQKPEDVEDLTDDDFDLSEDELNAILESEEELDDDWNWGDELKQEIVDQDEVDDTDISIEDDQIEDASEDLFDQLEESLKEDDDESEDQDIAESLLTLEEELLDANTSEEEIEEADEKSELEKSEEDDKLDSLLQKKDEKLSFMAKVKQKLGVFFWVLVGVFVLSTVGGVYYFLFIPTEIDISDPLLDQYEVAAADTQKTDTTLITTVAADSLEQKSEQVSDHKTEEKPAEIKDHHNTEQQKPQTENKIVEEEPKKQEQKSVSEDKTVIKTPTNGEIRIIENPAETKVGNTQIYKLGNKYSMQVSSWRKKSQAEKEARRLLNKGYDVFIVKVYLRSLGSTWYRVRVGDFNTIEEAKKFEVKN